MDIERVIRAEYGRGRPFWSASSGTSTADLTCCHPALATGAQVALRLRASADEAALERPGNAAERAFVQRSREALGRTG
jgi:hypothetical protein